MYGLLSLSGLHNRKDFHFQVLFGILPASSYRANFVKEVLLLHLESKIRTIYLKSIQKEPISSFLQIFILVLKILFKSYHKYYRTLIPRQFSTTTCCLFLSFWDKNVTLNYILKKSVYIISITYCSKNSSIL